MKNQGFIQSWISICLFGFCLSINSNSFGQTFSCPANDKWITQPNAPKEVSLGKNAQFCQFYQISWQWFLQLVSPLKFDPTMRNFQVATDYPILETPINGVQPDSCDTEIPAHGLYMHASKSTDNDAFAIPDRTGQAGGGAVIYDQQGNAAFYDVRFSRNLCDVGKVQSEEFFPPETTELKTAWKIISASEKENYFWMEADIDGIPGTRLLGMVGFHIGIATPDHPEFVWTIAWRTFEMRRQ